MRSLPILANANHMMVEEEKLLTHIKLIKTPKCFGKTFRSDNFRTLVQLSGTFWAPPLEDIFTPFHLLIFWTPVAYFGTPYCLSLGTRKYGVPWLLFEWEIKYHISIRNIFETKHLTNFPSFGNTYAVTPIDTFPSPHIRSRAVFRCRTVAFKFSGVTPERFSIRFFENSWIWKIVSRSDRVSPP